MREMLAWGLLAGACALYAVAELVPGRFLGVDEVFYKSAGRNWALTGHFAAPEIVGRLSQGPPLTQIYFAQPPLYSFLFGLYTRLVGFGPRWNILFDVLIHILLVGSAVLVSRRVFRLPPLASALAGALCIPLGTVGRSDELAICFLLWAWTALPTHRRAGLGGALAGLSLATSLTAFVFLGPLIAWHWLHSQPRRDWPRKLGTAAVAAVGVLGACVSPILIRFPSAILQLISHGEQQSAFIGAWHRHSASGLVRAVVEPWLGLKDGWPYEVLMVALALFFLTAWMLDHGSWQKISSGLLLAGAEIILLGVLLPGKFFYLWYLGIWLLLVAVVTGWETWQVATPARRRSLAAGGAALWLLAALPYARQKLILWTLPPGQELMVSMQQVREAIPPGAGVMTSAYWPALGNRDHVYDPVFSHPDPGEVQYIVLSGNGSGRPVRPDQFRNAYARPGARVVSDHLNRVPPRLWGLRLSHSAYGFGAYILRNPDSTSPHLPNQGRSATPASTSTGDNSRHNSAGVSEIR